VERFKNEKARKRSLNYTLSGEKVFATVAGGKTGVIDREEKER